MFFNNNGVLSLLKRGGMLTYLLNILSRANFLSPDVGINVNSQLTLLVSYSTLLF